MKFFEKDKIEWNDHIELHNFYKILLTLRSTNKALRCGDPDVLTKIISHPEDEHVFAYLRKYKSSQVFVILNCSAQGLNFEVKNVKGLFTNLLWNDDVDFEQKSLVWLNPWDALVFEKLNVV